MLLLTFFAIPVIVLCERHTSQHNDTSNRLLHPPPPSPPSHYSHPKYPPPPHLHDWLSSSSHHRNQKPSLFRLLNAKNLILVNNNEGFKDDIHSEYHNMETIKPRATALNYQNQKAQQQPYHLTNDTPLEMASVSLQRKDIISKLLDFNLFSKPKLSEILEENSIKMIPLKRPLISIRSSSPSEVIPSRRGQSSESNSIAEIPKPEQQHAHLNHKYKSSHQEHTSIGKSHNNVETSNEIFEIISNPIDTAMLQQNLSRVKNDHDNLQTILKKVVSNIGIYDSATLPGHPGESKDIPRKQQIIGRKNSSPENVWTPPLHHPDNRVDMVSGYGNKTPSFSPRSGFGISQGADDSSR